MSAFAPGMLLGLLVFALTASFVFSGSETGLISVDPLRVRHLVEARRRGARRLARLLERQEQTLVAVLVGNNLALVVATVACLGLLQQALEAVWPAARAERYAQVLTPLVLTPAVLFACEILPKSLFRARPLELSLVVAPIVSAFRWLSTPVSAVLVRGTQALVRLATGGAAEQSPLVTREELMRFFRQGEEGGALETDEHNMIQGIIDFGHQTAKEVMVPRSRMTVARDTATCGELYDLIEREGHSRIPIYRGTVDVVVGVVHARDLLGGAYEGGAPITPIIRPITHVPESMRLDDLLHEMRLKQRSVVIVVDEHGGMAGMLTVEDLIEEIVGDIRDEYDEDEAPAYRRLPDGSFLVQATMTLSEANTELQLGIADPEVVETIGGYLIQLQGRIPAPGETIVSHGLQFHVMAATDRAVQRVRIRRLPQPGEPGA